MKKFIDIGINLTDPMFRGMYREKQVHQGDLDLVIERAKNAGVQRMIVTGTNLDDGKEAVALTDKYDGFLYSTVGCHPTRCREFDHYPEGPEAYLQALRTLIKDNLSVVAIGECGLDYDRLHFCDKETQLKYFKVQFDLAKESGLPMFLHNRNTNGDFYAMIQEHRTFFTHGVVHSFTGSLEEMQQLINLNLYIGINGCSLKTEENLKVVQAIPRDRLMIETDGPWCDIRPTHASFQHLNQAPKDEMDLYLIPNSKKKEKFEMGCTVKNRCEPCSIG
ncbi:Mg-dependent DNase [Hesseltinella vesiculosa]|uniref:Mg-dependent DNase n=1 Tax=Hesseltinella vesiculosa TaxID=101127 RepID=A0A1X2GP59_9FUNG|nr:Mg-dependent DNase [Hesseltinella vesiculosa]